MVANIRAGGAAVNVLARQAGAAVVVVDVGVAADLPAGDDLLARKVAPGTGDLATGPAMSRQQAEQALLTGASVAEELVGRGHDVLLTGDMGIANTTPSAALVAAMTGTPPDEVTGRGTGVDDVVLARKTAIVADAVGRLSEQEREDPVAVLAAVGGFEHAAMAGFLLAGVEVADRLVDAGHDCLLTGDMGIANTTPSAALVAAFTGAAPGSVTGRGTGVDDPTLARKVEVIATALLERPPGGDPVGTLASLGGFEHAGLAGFVLGAAARRVPVILDGLIAGSAALVAQALAPVAVDYCFAGHRSVEPGHVVALAQLGLRPLVDLDLRLGEGTGAVLSFPLVESAGAVLREMATFDSAGVTRKDDEPVR
jgi:nicotinate-nucleotide--dimethylbenzimidazole phosphoribosyltransferase